MRPGCRLAQRAWLSTAAAASRPPVPLPPPSIKRATPLGDVRPHGDTTNDDDAAAPPPQDAAASLVNRSPALMSAAERERHEELASMLRVDHAGELAAKAIYAGQLAVAELTPWQRHDHAAAAALREMKDAEQVHLDTFDEELPRYGVRPSAFLGIWGAAGFALGVGTALLGRQSAMACHVAVEHVIAEHYTEQLAEMHANGLGASEPKVRQIFRRFRDEELGHMETAQEHGAKDSPLYGPIFAVVSGGCRVAVEVAKRL